MSWGLIVTPIVDFFTIHLRAFEFEGAKPFATVRFDDEAASASASSQSLAPVAAKAAPDHMIKLVVKHL